MRRLKTLRSRVPPAASRGPAPTTTEAQRITGRRLQQIREHHWLKDPHCARCGRYVGFPDGFELDHNIPLFKGGQDIESNRQILCLDDGDREGCHTIKTREDMQA